jgi:MFS family permease
MGGTLALDSFRRDFGLNMATQSARDTLQGNIVSTLQLGYVGGALATIPIAERLGRRKSNMLSACIILLGDVLMTASDGSQGMIIAGRVVAGECLLDVIDAY